MFLFWNNKSDYSISYQKTHDTCTCIYIEEYHKDVIDCLLSAEAYGNRNAQHATE